MPSGALALAILLAAPCALSAAPAKKKKAIAVGDGVIVTLKNGGEVKGMYRGNADGAFWVESNGAEIGIERDSIEKVSPASTPEADYRKQKETLDKKDANAWWKLSQTATRGGMKAAAIEAARAAVRIAPDHTAAREFLGHQKVDGRWLTLDEVQAAKGLTLYGGQWLTESELAEARSRDSSEDLMKRMHANDPVHRPPEAVRERKQFHGGEARTSPKPTAGRVDYFGSGGR